MGKFGKTFTPPKVTILLENPEKALARRSNRSNSVSLPPGFLIISKIYDNFSFCKSWKSQF
jgi:hypothetical protein